MRGKVYGFMAHMQTVTHKHRQESPYNLYNTVHHQNEQAKKKKKLKGVTDGFVQAQMDTFTFFRTISAMKCSLDDYQFPSPPKSSVLELFFSSV